MRRVPAVTKSRSDKNNKCRPLCATAILALLLFPQPALAAGADVVSTAVTFGAVALAIGASLWAIASDHAAAKLRHSVRAIHARARAAVAARDGIIEAGREKVLVWGGDTEAAQSYGGSEELLDACLAGPDALLLSQALDDLAATGAPFALSVHSRQGETILVRGRAVGGFSALWMEKEIASATAGAADVRAALDALPVPVWLRDRSLALLWVNQAYATAVGIIDASSAVIAQAILEKSERELAAAARAERRTVEAKRYAVVAGQRRALAFTEIPIDDGAILGMAVDVTELSNAQARLQQHLDAHADTLDKLATAVAIFGRDRRLAFHNRAFAKLWELPEDWLETHPGDGEILDRLRELRRLPEQRDYQTWKRERLAAYEHPDAFLPEEPWHLPSGKTLRVVAQPHPFGGLTYLYEDITEKLALESSYNTLIGVQRATLDTLGEGVAVFGLDGRLKLHNAAFARLWQFQPDELPGELHIKDIAEVCIQRFGDEAVWQRLVTSLLAGADRRSEWQIERSDRSILAVSLVPLPDGAMLVTCADVTDRYRVEAVLRERNEALMAADELKSAFVQHASFLFRDPLNAVQGFADMLAGGHAGTLNAKQKDYVLSILSASHKLAEVTSDILDLAMIESGNMRLELAPADLFELLIRAAEPLRQHVASRDIAFHFDVAPEIGLAVLDQRRIRQVIFNLLSNALKYTPRGGAITLGAQIAGDDVQISVADSGPGIAADLQPRVFDRFEAKGRAGQRAGAGLGLALVNSFVALHDGWVEIETGEGRGTLVRCHLPRRLGEKSPLSQRDIHAA